MSGAPLARRSSQVALTVDVSVLAALAALGIFGFAASFGGLEYLRAGLGGVGVGILAALIAARLRFGAILSAAVAAALYFLLGAPLAVPGQALFAVLPTQASITSLAQGAIFGWSDVVTLSAPVEAPDYLAVLPYVAGWIVATVSTTLAARWFVSRGRTPARSAASSGKSR